MTLHRPDSELLELLDAVCDGTITGMMMQRLEQRLIASETDRSDYCRYLHLHAGIRQAGGAAPPVQVTGVVARDHAKADRPERSRISSRPSRIKDRSGETGFSIRFAYALAAAVLLAAAALAVYIFENSHPIKRDAVGPPIATLIDATGTVIYDKDIANPGSEYASGTYSLDSGSAQFLLNNHVTVDLEGATRLVMHDTMRATLAHGSATFYCPPEAHGFTVHLPGNVRVTDLGTRFAIRLTEGNRGWVDVLKGRVELRGADGIAQAFTSGEIGEIDLARGAFVRHSIDAANRIQPIAYWSFDTDFSATVGDSRFDAAPVNGPVVDPEGHIGGAARFDRARSQYLRVTNPVLPNEAGKDHSYAAWYKLDRSDVDEQERFFVLETTSQATSTHAWTASYGLRDMGEGHVGQVFTSYTPRGEQDFAVPGAHADSQTPNLPDGWMHIAVVYDADGGSSLGNGRLTVFLNGEAVGGFDTEYPLAPTDGLIIGGHRDGVGRNFDGWIDEVAFWDRALSADQVQRVHRLGVRSLVHPILGTGAGHPSPDMLHPQHGERTR